VKEEKEERKKKGGGGRTLESTVTVSFLSLHLPVDKPERVLIEPNHQISVQRKSRGLSSDDNARCVRGCIQGYTTAISSISMAREKGGQKLEWVTYIVKQMLMSRSQLQPVMNPAAAGGNKIAT
jgi:hypothetical protein